MLLVAVILPIAGMGGLVRYEHMVRHGRRASNAASVVFLEFGILLVSIGVALVVLRPGPSPSPRAVEIVPFTGLIFDSSAAALWMAGANMVLLLPVGLLLPMRFDRFREKGRIVAAGIALPALIEGLQYVFGLHRIASVDDVIFGAMGFVAGGLIGFRVVALAAREERRRRRRPE